MFWHTPQIILTIGWFSVFACSPILLVACFSNHQGFRLWAVRIYFSAMTIWYICMTAGAPTIEGQWTIANCISVLLTFGLGIVIFLLHSIIWRPDIKIPNAD